LNKHTLYLQIASKTKLSQKQAAAMLDATLCSIREALEGGDTIRLVRFGTFRVHTIPEHKGTHPRTRESITIPTSERVRFRPHQALATAVNKEQ
jgi:DNA-binding protein HU-beta